MHKEAWSKTNLRQNDALVKCSAHVCACVFFVFARFSSPQKSG